MGNFLEVVYKYAVNFMIGDYMVHYNYQNVISVIYGALHLSQTWTYFIKLGTSLGLKSIFYSIYLLKFTNKSNK